MTLSVNNGRFKETVETTRAEAKASARNLNQLHIIPVGRRDFVVNSIAKPIIICNP